MVLTSITILSAVLANFTFDTRINKLKSINLQDQIQARLNAEAGLNLAVARLRLYKEIYNKLQENKDAKDFVSPQLMNQVWEVPFALPLPIDKNKLMANQKANIKEFEEKILLGGELQVSIKNISNKINLNLLRVRLEEDTNPSGTQGQDQDQKLNETIDFQIYQLFANAIKRESEKDEFFFDKYRSLDDPMILVSSMKYFMSEPNSFEDDYSAQVVGLYQENEITPKHGIFSSDSELHLIARLDDTLINLVAGEVTAHGSLMIDLNTITDSMLRLLVPEITDDNVAKFFEYRDDPQSPKYFNQVSEFKSYIVDTLGAISEADFTSYFDRLEKAGLKFGPSPTLFEVNATGIQGRANYNLKAIVKLPAFQEEIKKNQNPNGQGQETTPPAEPPAGQEGEDSQDLNGNGIPDNQEGDNQQEKEYRTKLLEPRVQEIFVN